VAQLSDFSLGNLPHVYASSRFSPSLLSFSFFDFCSFQRGVGEGAIGTSLSLVGPTDEKIHSQICRAINGPSESSVKGGSKELTAAPLDQMLLQAAKERVNLASKIVLSSDIESRASKTNNWYAKAASECGLELDEDVLEKGQAGGDDKERQKLGEAKRARGQLAELLAKPMKKQHFGKFLGSAGATAAAAHAKAVTPFVPSAEVVEKIGGGSTAVGKAAKKLNKNGKVKGGKSGSRKKQRVA